MKKNDLIKTENGIFRILSIEADRVLAIDCIKKTMPKFYLISSFGNGEFIDCLDADFPDMEDLSPTHRKVAQERYTMIASAVSVVDDKKLKALGRGSQNNLNADMVKNYPIVLPTKEVQEFIISRLDEFSKEYFCGILSLRLLICSRSVRGICGVFI